MSRRQLKVGFVEEPVVDWDIELKPMILGMGLDFPDVIEVGMLALNLTLTLYNPDPKLNPKPNPNPNPNQDGVLTFAIRKGLYRFDINNPLTIDLNPDEAEPEAH